MSDEELIEFYDRLTDLHEEYFTNIQELKNNTPSKKGIETQERVRNIMLCLSDKDYKESYSGDSNKIMDSVLNDDLNVAMEVVNSRPECLNEHSAYHGKTALIMSAEKCATDSNDKTPPNEREKQKEIMNLLLLQSGIDLKARDLFTGKTALHIAYIKGDALLVEKLLEKDPQCAEVMDFEMKKPADYAGKLYKKSQEELIIRNLQLVVDDTKDFVEDKKTETSKDATNAEYKKEKTYKSKQDTEKTINQNNQSSESKMRVKEQRSESAIHDVKSNDVKSNDAKSHDANDRRDTNKGVVDNAEAENRDKANRDNVHIVDFANIISKSFGVGGITAEMKEMMLKIVSEMSDVNHPVKSCDVVGGYKGKTLLELMAMHGCRPEDGEKFEEVVRGICNRGGDINLKSGFSKSAPIYSAIGNGNSNVAYIMIKTFGSRINYESKDGNGNNFAHFILMNGYLTRPKITKLFQEDDKRSALSLLGDVIKYSPSIVNSKMIDGNTPLHIACMKRDLGAVKLLIQNGADIETLNKSGLKPCDMLKFQYPEVCKYLKQYVLFPQAFRQSHSNNKNREEIANFINDIANVSVVSRINTSDNSAKAKQAERNDMEIDVKSSTSKPATSKPATSKTRDRMLSRYKSSDRKMDKESDELRLQKNEKNSQIKSQINRKKSYARFVSEKRANQSSFVGGRF